VIAAAAAAVAVQSFRYERTVRPAGSGPALVVADAAMLAHTRPDFSDVRVVDARGDQVPWRQPLHPQSRDVAVDLVDVGRRGTLAVARFANRGLVDRVVLAVPDRRFHGKVTVYGSDDRRTWTRLSTTEIFAVGGARPTRSTTALVPRADYRWFELRASGVTRIDGAHVVARALPEPLERLPGTLTGHILDLHYRVPVAQLDLSASTRRYSRPFRILTGDGVVVATGVLERNGTPHTTVVPLDVTARRLRIVVANGDNPPLRGLRVLAFARVRTLIVEGGHAPPLRLYYGATVAAPQYDFARLPLRQSTQTAALGAEQANPQFHVADTRSFFAKHGSLVTVALALAAALLVAAGALALRRT
jgi:hypothetical protein